MSESMGGIIPECPGDFVGIRNQPTELDRQTLADRQEVWNRTHPRSLETEARSVSDRDGPADRLDYD